MDFETRIYFHNFVEVCYKCTMVVSRWHSYIVKVVYCHHRFLLFSVKAFLIIQMSQQNTHQFSLKTTWQRNVSVCNTHTHICNIPWKWSWSMLQTGLPGPISGWIRAVSWIIRAKKGAAFLSYSGCPDTWQ